MITIIIDTDNEAFDDGIDGTTEVSRILRQLSTDIYANEMLQGSKLTDINGNTVGEVKIS